MKDSAHPAVCAGRGRGGAGGAIEAKGRGRGGCHAQQHDSCMLASQYGWSSAQQTSYLCNGHVCQGGGCEGLHTCAASTDARGGREGGCIPVQRARMPAYVVPFTVLASIFCTKRASFETMAAVRWACIFSVTCRTISTWLSSYSVRTCKSKDTASEQPCQLWTIGALHGKDVTNSFLCDSGLHLKLRRTTGKLYMCQNKHNRLTACKTTWCFSSYTLSPVQLGDAKAACCTSAMILCGRGGWGGGGARVGG